MQYDRLMIRPDCIHHVWAEKSVNSLHWASDWMWRGSNCKTSPVSVKLSRYCHSSSSCNSQEKKEENSSFFFLDRCENTPTSISTSTHFLKRHVCACVSQLWWTCYVFVFLWCDMARKLITNTATVCPFYDFTSDLWSSQIDKCPPLYNVWIYSSSPC